MCGASYDTTLVFSWLNPVSFLQDRNERYLWPWIWNAALMHGTIMFKGYKQQHKLMYISKKDITQFSTSFMLSKGCYTLHWVSLTLLRVRCSHWCFLQKHWVTGGNSCAHHSVPSMLPVSEAQPGDLWWLVCVCCTNQLQYWQTSSEG